MVDVKVDTTRFERDLQLYLKETSKTVEDAINYKLFDATRAAIKGTDKADKSKVKESLDAMSTKYPDRTVAEMLVIVQKEKSGETVFDLQAEVTKLKNKRYSSIGFTKAGWLPALKKLLRFVGKEAVSISGIMKAAFGGADPARTTGSTVIGSSYNDVRGTGNTSKVEKLKEIGAQAGIDKASLDMETYLSKKLDIPIERFNSST